MNSKPKFVIGTRKSLLALWQSRHIADLMTRSNPTIEIELKEIVTKGDLNPTASLPSIGGKGLFTAELEVELLAQTIDFAVHSLKDLPTEMGRHFTLGAIGERRWGGDVLISKGNLPFRALSPGAIIGTSSPRRECQLKKMRSDLIYRDIRGNVETRIKKVREGEFDATVLAEAGVTRLGLEHEIAERFSSIDLLSAPGQGALAVQCLKERKDALFLTLLEAVESDETRIETSAERAFLHALHAGCSTPVAARGSIKGKTMTLHTASFSHKGEQLIRLEGQCKATVHDGEALAVQLAKETIKNGFKLLE